MPYDKSKTPSERRRAPKGSVTRRLDIAVSARTDAALEFLIETLKAKPHVVHAANKRGATSLGIEEAAKARGWKPPNDEEDETP